MGLIEGRVGGKGGLALRGDVLGELDSYRAAYCVHVSIFRLLETRTPRPAAAGDLLSFKYAAPSAICSS